jgi:hypothetical protein
MICGIVLAPISFRDAVANFGNALAGFGFEPRGSDNQERRSS